MKTKIMLLLSFFISITAHGDSYYVKPNILAKQFLTETKLKKTLINALRHKQNCFNNLNSERVTKVTNDIGILTKITDNKERRVCIDSCIAKRKRCCAGYTPSTCPRDCEHHATQGSIACKSACRDDNPAPPAPSSDDTEVIIIGDFSDTNIAVVKMKIEGSDDDRTLTVYYKRKGLKNYNTIDNDDRSCSGDKQASCFKAECSLEFREGDKCKLLSCCRDCWSITGGL